MERAGRAAASELGIEPSDWWDCAYGDDDLEEDAEPSESGKGHAHADPDLH